MSDPSINEHYTQDHDRLDELFHQFQAFKSSDRRNAARFFGEFKAGLERHIVWEEQILFPAFENKTGVVTGPTEVMRREHRQIQGFLETIAGKLTRGDSDTADDEAGLLAVLEPHNRKEEGILYPMIDQITAAEEREQIFARMSMMTSR